MLKLWWWKQYSTGIRLRADGYPHWGKYSHQVYSSLWTDCSRYSWFCGMTWSSKMSCSRTWTNKIVCWKRCVNFSCLFAYCSSWAIKHSPVLGEKPDRRKAAWINFQQKSYRWSCHFEIARFNEILGKSAASNYGRIENAEQQVSILSSTMQQTHSKEIIFDDIILRESYLFKGTCFQKNLWHHSIKQAMSKHWCLSESVRLGCSVFSLIVVFQP